MGIPIKGKIWKTGSGTYVITIPKDYIKNGLLHEGEEIVLVIKESLEQTKCKETFKKGSAVTKDDLLSEGEKSSHSGVEKNAPP